MFKRLARLAVFLDRGAGDHLEGERQAIVQGLGDHHLVGVVAILFVVLMLVVQIQCVGRSGHQHERAFQCGEAQGGDQTVVATGFAHVCILRRKKRCVQGFIQ